MTRIQSSQTEPPSRPSASMQEERNVRGGQSQPGPLDRRAREAASQSLEGWVGAEIQFGTATRVLKTQLCSMEFELPRAGPVAIQGVTDDRSPEPEFVSSVHTQLMRSARDRSKENSREARFHRNLLPMRYADLAMNRIMNLVWAIFYVETKGKLDRTAFPRQDPLEKREVSLPCFSSLKLHGEFTMRFGIASNDE